MNHRAKSRYRVVYTSLWGDATFRRFSQEAKHLWFYLTTAPHTTALDGLSSISEATLADKLGWTLEDLRHRWAEIEGAGWGQADWEADVVWLPHEMGEGKPDNHKVVIGWASLVPDIPECPLRDEAFAAIVARCEARSRECAAGSKDAVATLREWRDAIRRVFGDDTVPHTVSSRGSDTVSDAPSDAPCDRVSDTVSDTLPDTRNRNRSRTSPPTPSGGEDRKAGGGEFSKEKEDRAAKAREIVNAYVGAAGVPHCSSESAVPVVADLLGQGVSEATLRLAGETYAAGETRVGSDVRKRFGPTTFYKGEWKKFEGGPKKPVYVPAPIHAIPKRPHRTPEEIAANRKILESCIANKGVPASTAPTT